MAIIPSTFADLSASFFLILILPFTSSYNDQVPGRYYVPHIIFRIKSYTGANGKRVNLLNEVKDLYPNDWWQIADDDELQLYWEPIEDLIKDCEKHG